MTLEIFRSVVIFGSRAVRRSQGILDPSSELRLQRSPIVAMDEVRVLPDER